MKSRPMLFSASMVRALLDGSKTQTRRVLNQATGPSLSVDCSETGQATLSWLFGDGPGHPVMEQLKFVQCPYGQPGDQLWVRENFSGPHCMEKTADSPAFPPSQWPKESPIWYWADDEPTYGDWTRPRPSIHMPRWASRITLEITRVRVERLQDISEADAQTEGCETVCMTPTGDDNGSAIYGPDGYAALWESINGAGAWAANPWVWVIEFKRATQ